jgi:hypothetical protein
VAWLAYGCGKVSGPDSGQACMDVAAARCNQRSACSLLSGDTGPGASVKHVYGDMATCVRREALICQNGLAAPQTGNSPAKVELCVSEIPTQSCQEYFDNNPPSDCAITGARAGGATCTFNGQCQSGYCRGLKNSVCGACADPPGPGADCADSICWHGQRCIATTMTCAAVVSLNGACDAANPCDSGLACTGTTATAMGTCQPAGATTGVPCGATNAACDNALGLYCAGPIGAKTCTEMTFVGDGMPCGALADGTRAECIAGDCYAATGLAGIGAMGTCRAAALETAANPQCDTVLGPGCLPPARCVVSGSDSSGTCVVPTAAACPL